MPFRWQRSSAASRETKGGFHSGAEAVPVADRGDAGEQGVDEDRPAVRAEADVVRVEIAGHPGRVRRVDRVEALRVRLAGRQDIVEALDLILGGEREAAPVGADAEPHAAREAALEHREPAVRLDPEQEQLARLIGGEGEAAAGPGQPGGEAARRGERERLVPRGAGARLFLHFGVRIRAKPRIEGGACRESWKFLAQPPKRRGPFGERNDPRLGS